MKRSGHDDYASGDVTKTGDKSALRGVCRKTSFKLKLKLINSIWMQT